MVAAARAIQDIFVARAQARAILERGGPWRGVQFEDLRIELASSIGDVLALNAALQLFALAHRAGTHSLCCGSSRSSTNRKPPSPPNGN